MAGKHAHSTFTVVGWTRSVKAGWITTVDVTIHTGRKHQIRIHAARDLGCSVVGDPLYDVAGRGVGWRRLRGGGGGGGDEEGKAQEGACRSLRLKGNGLFLRAVALEFSHPVTGEAVRTSIPEPPKFAAHRRKETQWYARLRARLSHFPLM